LREGFERFGGLRAEHGVSPNRCPEILNSTELKISRENPSPRTSKKPRYAIFRCLERRVVPEPFSLVLIVQIVFLL
jgi:hypothetical protein